jgi:hypothetical protein
LLIVGDPQMILGQQFMPRQIRLLNIIIKLESYIIEKTRTTPTKAGNGTLQELEVNNF